MQFVIGIVIEIFVVVAVIGIVFVVVFIYFMEMNSDPFSFCDYDDNMLRTKMTSSKAKTVHLLTNVQIVKTLCSKSYNGIQLSFLIAL